LTLEIVRIPVLSDNYVWLVREAATGAVMVVDPAVAEPVLAEADKRGWTITHIWNTHCTITGPAAEAERIPTLDVRVEGGDVVTFGELEAQVIDVPAHTAGHIAFHFASERVIFVGDTLFAMGCGRLFEGTAAQMFQNMQTLSALPEDTQVYCAHEYTQSNGRYALSAEPGNAALIARMKQVDADRAAGLATVPTTIGLERATNPFMRAATVEQLAERRAAKDSFRG
jgi:hydroxyacylglutathione hydrolase